MVISALKELLDVYNNGTRKSGAERSQCGVSDSIRRKCYLTSLSTTSMIYATRGRSPAIHEPGGKRLVRYGTVQHTRVYGSSQGMGAPALDI